MRSITLVAPARNLTGTILTISLESMSWKPVRNLSHRLGNNALTKVRASMVEARPQTTHSDQEELHIAFRSARLVPPNAEM